MSSPQYPYPPQPPHVYGPPPPQGPNHLLAIAAAGAIVAILANGFVYYQLHDLREELTHAQGVMQNEIDTIKENSTVMTAAQKKHLDDLKEDLDAKARQMNAAANQAASQAKKEAVSYADEQARKLEQENQQTKQAVAQTNNALSDVKQRADTANAKLADVGTDVQGVKTDLQSTKTDLDRTKSELKKVSGDLGVTNGYVATNSKELEELKRRGEVSIVEFSLKKQKNMQKVGDISLLLEKSDPKKNRFNVIVLADDKRVEKKDRTVNEPLQFYVSKSLYQVVVLSVGKDQISGYLQTPKYQSR
jgi:DNA repair exonuclease SbcCD ATPase subunit